MTRPVPKFKNRYRVWLYRRLSDGELWAVASCHGDGVKRTPFIIAKSCGEAFDRLRKRRAKLEWHNLKGYYHDDA